MRVKICVCSDNHGEIDCLDKIRQDNPDCDYYFHLGDSQLSDNLIAPFITVKGNNDWGMNFPMQIIIEINNRKILLIHGSGYTYAISGLVNKAKHENCDVIMFGHTHEFFDDEYKGIRLINPGSCWRNRDCSKPCYALVYIDDSGKIDVERIDL